MIVKCLHGDPWVDQLILLIFFFFQSLSLVISLLQNLTPPLSYTFASSGEYTPGMLLWSVITFMTYSVEKMQVQVQIFPLLSHEHFYLMYFQRPMSGAQLTQGMSCHLIMVLKLVS